MSACVDCGVYFKKCLTVFCPCFHVAYSVAGLNCIFWYADTVIVKR